MIKDSRLTSGRLIYNWSLLAGSVLVAATFFVTALFYAIRGTAVPVFYVVMGASAGCVLCVGTQRLNLTKAGKLVVVNLVQVHEVPAGHLRGVDPAPQMTFRTNAGDIKSTVFTSSNFARLRNDYARWRAIADRVETWDAVRREVLFGGAETHKFRVGAVGYVVGSTAVTVCMYLFGG